MKDETERDYIDFVTHQANALCRTAYLLCGDWHAAEDIVQVTLAKVYAAWPRLRKDVTPDAYTRRILVRAHIDETRRPWRREVTSTAFPEPAASTGLAMEEREALMAALNSLAPGQRRVVVLRHWLGLSVEETAADLGCSTGTVKSQTVRAVTRLRAALEGGALTTEDNHEPTR